MRCLINLEIYNGQYYWIGFSLFFFVCYYYQFFQLFTYFQSPLHIVRIESYLVKKHALYINSQFKVPQAKPHNFMWDLFICCLL